jgi:hypothetical protein
LDSIIEYIDNFLIGIQPSRRKRFMFIKKYLFFNSTVTTFLAIYHVLTFKTFYNFFKFINQFNMSRKDSYYSVYFNFRSNKFFISILNSKGRLYTSLSVGLFLKFFQNKKSLKKNKLFKLLLSKYLRKLLIVSNIKNIYLYIKRTPTHIYEICNLLTSPLPKPFFNPLKGVSVIESNEKHYNLNIRYIYFSKIKSYTSMKVCRKGRLKRKIQKRILKSNRITD